MLTIITVAILLIIGGIIAFYQKKLDEARTDAARDLARVNRKLGTSEARLSRYMSRNRNLENAISRINTNERRKLDGLPHSAFMGIDQMGSVKRKTALTYSAVEHPETGITVHASKGVVAISRNGRPLVSYTKHADHYSAVRAADELAVNSVGG